jgi:hypothetical protein
MSGGAIQVDPAHHGGTGPDAHQRSDLPIGPRGPGFGVLGGERLDAIHFRRLPSRFEVGELT